MKEKIKSDFIYWLRWFAVFPGAVLFGLLATFPLHWILYGTLVSGEMISGVNIAPIERFLYPFVIAFTYIFAGYKIAPKNKFQTAIVLFVIYLVVWLIGIIIGLFKINIYGLDIQFSLRAALALIGAILSLYTTKKVDNEKKT